QCSVTQLIELMHGVFSRLTALRLLAVATATPRRRALSATKSHSRIMSANYGALHYRLISSTLG
ncbi:MAG: hypothetical protein ACRETC_05470, partial [Gammaproteobacteria bacterium]